MRTGPSCWPSGETSRWRALPQDLKFEIEELRVTEAAKVARFLAGIVGQAHARKLDAPSWLWTSMVDLMMNHEGAYLEHCRRYALEVAQ